MDPIDPTPRYSPDAIAKGSEIDRGVQIPESALRDPTGQAFMDWAKENGLGHGLSITIDGLIAPPGRDVISASTERRAPAAKRRTWVDPGLSVDSEGVPTTDLAAAIQASHEPPEGVDESGFDWTTGEQKPVESDDDGGEES